jgi:homogentisate 1,2-dioxygenase
MEQMITRDGFNGPFSILYYRTPPTDEFEVVGLRLKDFGPPELVAEQPLHRRHLRTAELSPAGDYLTGRRTLLVCPHLYLGVIKPTEPPQRYFSNGDGDELYFVDSGSGYVDSVYGLLPFREHDYIVIPKSTPYRLRLAGDRGTLLVFEGRPRLGIPGDYRNCWGQLTDYAPYSHRDFRVPQELLPPTPPLRDRPFELVVKRGDELTVHRYRHFPLDVVGWDGVLYPVAFNIHDFQPKTGLVHLPPTIHTTFSGEGFVICSFVPRKVDYHEQAIPCPYAHASVDMDEVLYYVAGDFTSRRGIGAESISLHPQGVTHGPHPDTYENSIGMQHTNELAVMCDTVEPLRLTTAAARVEDKDYHQSWVTREGDSTWTRK